MVVLGWVGLRWESLAGLGWAGRIWGGLVFFLYGGGLRVARWGIARYLDGVGWRVWGERGRGGRKFLGPCRGFLGLRYGWVGCLDGVGRVVVFFGVLIRGGW